MSVDVPELVSIVIMFSHRESVRSCGFSALAAQICWEACFCCS